MSENINDVVNGEVVENPNELVKETVETVEETVETVEETVDPVEEVVEAAKEAVTVDPASMLDRDEADLALVRKRQIIDKITTGLLILLMCTPFAILLYIIIWFLNP